MEQGDKTVYLRIPQPIIDAVDRAVSEKLYSNRAEAYRALLRAGMASVVFSKQK